jgi:hypothetical protein
MKKMSWKYKFLSLVGALIIMFGILPVSPVYAASSSITLNDFAAAIKSTDATKLVGVFVEDILAVRVVQQSSAGYVSSISNTVTQFSLAKQYGSIGFLAHNYLAGSRFSELKSGAEIVLVYGDGSTKTFKVIAIKKYQALSPKDPYSQFVSLDNPDTTLTSTELFKETYGTCITNNGETAWGRLFIIASPA